MVAAQYAREDEEEAENDDEDHEDRADVVPLSTLNVVSSIRVVQQCLVTGTEGQVDGDDLGESLRDEEEPELAVIELAHAAADPEAVVVKLSHASVAFPAMPASVRLLQIACLAESFSRKFYLFHYNREQKLSLET